MNLKICELCNERTEIRMKKDAFTMEKAECVLFFRRQSQRL